MKPAACTVVLALALVSGCSVQNLIQNREYIADSLQRPATVAAARGTFLLRSSRMFYPGDLPRDPQELPRLGADERQALSALVTQALASVNAAQERHLDALRAVTGAVNPQLGRSRVLVVDQDSAVAAVDATGALLISARVVQGIYRSALLQVLAESGDGPGAERAAFQRFAGLRRGIDGMSPLQPLSDLEAFSAGTSAREGLPALFGGMGGGKSGDLLDRMFGTMLAGMGGVLERRMQDLNLSQQSAALESSFMGAVQFLVAHEVGHLVLGHFPLSPVCHEAIARELAADRHAALVSLLVQADSLPGLRLQASGGSIGANGADAIQRLSASPAPAVAQFFRHAYGLAGFDANLAAAPGCHYPSPADREAAVGPLYDAGTNLLESARMADGLRRARAQRADPAAQARDFDARFGELQARAARRSAGEVQLLARHEPLLRHLFVSYRGEP